MRSIRSRIQFHYVANPVQGPSVGGIVGEQNNQVVFVEILVYVERERNSERLTVKHET